VCVRIVRMNDVDIALFQFDYDLTWMGFFLSADKKIYSRYGGRDAGSDEGRMSINGLKVTMRRVLELHRRELAAKVKAPPPPAPKRPQDVFRVTANCLHCHQVWEGMRERQRETGTFDPASLWVYPLPENVGLVLDVDAGSRVAKVLPGSAAGRAGMKPGDELSRVGGVNVLAQADVLWALHNAPAKGRLGVEYRRDGRSRTAALELLPGWRRTDMSWRQSILKEDEKFRK
jgi:hypothetical protein